MHKTPSLGLALAVMILIAITGRPAAADPRLAVSAAYLLVPRAALFAAQQQPALPAAPRRSLAAAGNTNDLCSRAIAAAERTYDLPNGLLYAVGLAESGLLEEKTGLRRPWPWTVDIDGNGRFYDSEPAALAAVATAASSGRHSIDIGCMQVNLRQHPHAFLSLNEAFDPSQNADYAARYLLHLHRGRLDWLAAAGSYHSTTPALEAPYMRLVEAFYAGLRPSPTRAWSMLAQPAAVRAPAASLQSDPVLISPEQLRLRAAGDLTPLAAIRMLAIANALEAIGRAEAARVAHVHLHRVSTAP